MNKISSLINMEDAKEGKNTCKYSYFYFCIKY